MLRTVSLKENSDFKRLYRTGRSTVSASIVIYHQRNKLGYNRIGITTGKKLGKAVERNRVKRIIREAYRMNETKITNCCDFVFVARSRALTLKSTTLAAMMSTMLAGAGVIKK